MRITNIRFAQKANLGNYESLEFAAEAVIDEEDDINKATKKLSDYVDWNAQKPIREAKARSYKAIQNDANAPETKKAEAAKWLQMYENRVKEMEAL